MAFNPNKYKIERKYIAKRENTRPGTKLVSGTPKFFVAHDTGNPGAGADNHYNYFNTMTDRSASAHTFIDDKKILEIIPTGTGTDAAEKAWHVIYNVTTDNQRFGDDANDIAIGTELCFGGNINFNEAYARFVWYHAFLCHKFGKDPEKYIVGHEHLDPGRKTDPSNALKRYGKTYDQFIADVKKELAGEGEEDNVLKLTDYQWGVVVSNVQNLLDAKVINDKSWLTKAKDRSLTVSELTWLTFVVTTRK